MLKNTLAVLGLLSLMLVVGGASWEALNPRSSSPSARGPLGLTAAELPISRHFHTTTTIPANVAIQIPIPPSLGLLIRKVKLSTQGGLGSFNFSIDGQLVAVTNPAGTGIFFDPMLFVPPGSVLEVFAPSSIPIADDRNVASLTEGEARVSRIEAIRIGIQHEQSISEDAHFL